MDETAETKVLPFIKKFIGDNGFSPSLTMIGEKFGKTRQWAHITVQILVKKKLVERRKGNGRQRRLFVR